MTGNATEQLGQARGRVMILLGRQQPGAVGTAELKSLLTKIEMALWPVATDEDRSRALSIVEKDLRNIIDLVGAAQIEIAEPASDASH